MKKNIKILTINAIINPILILFLLSSCTVFRSYKYEKRDYWVNNQYKNLNYIDTNKLQKKVDQKQGTGENLYSSANIIRNRTKYVMDGACRTHREMKNTLLTYFMEHSPSWETNRSSASQEIPSILWNPKFHYHIQNCPPPVPILN